MYCMLGHSNGILTLNIVNTGHKDIGRSAMGSAIMKQRTLLSQTYTKEKGLWEIKKRLMDTEGCDKHEYELNK